MIRVFAHKGRATWPSDKFVTVFKSESRVSNTQLRCYCVVMFDMWLDWQAHDERTGLRLEASKRQRQNKRTAN
eukprot:2259444-Alexandrium_andersonii.AAC.1